MAKPPVVLLEFNELTPALMDRFIHAGELPNFSKLRRQSVEMISHATDSVLEPWVQWVTVHSGLTYEEHKVHRLDEGHKLEAPRLWDIASRHGLSSWVCGSMNVRYESDTRATILPDPWCTKIDPRPSTLEPYYRFVQKQVQDHTRANGSQGRGEYLRFLVWMARNGLTSGTIGALAAQLIGEMAGAKDKWKRVALLDQLQFDVFAHFYRRMRPALSTLFLNSTAHYQHAYWDELEPEKYGRATHTPATATKIAFGYKSMDALIGRVLELVGDEATIVLCTALSQAADPEAGTAKYRPLDFAKLATFAGLHDQYRVAPVMTAQFHLECETPELLNDAAKMLTSLRLEGQPVLRLRFEEGPRLFLSCAVRGKIAMDTPVVRPDGRSIPFSELFYKVPTSKLADHHPDGILWIRLPDKSHAAVAERVPLTSVAPTILSLMGVTPPAYMAEPLSVG